MTVAWVPVVDISRSQGWVDFRKMRANGVRGLILRIAHGVTLDAMVDAYYPQALAAGFAPNDIGFYPFINPKRASARAAATFAIDQIRRITGRDPYFYMVDVENYRDQSPNAGTAPVYGAAFAAHIREHLDTVAAIAPDTARIGYSNRAYWNGLVAGTTVMWVGDDQLASELDWIVARYPAYSPTAYATHPLPTSPDDWATWAFTLAPYGPFPPRGANGWRGWQFAAGYDAQGSAYGASSSDLDLNIVHPDAWAKWTGVATAPTPPEDCMNYYVVTGANARFIGFPPNVAWTGPGNAKVDAAIAAQLAAGNLTQVNLTGGPNAFASTFLTGPLPTGDPLHTWTGAEFAAVLPSAAGTVDQVARDGVVSLNAAVARVGQELGDTKANLLRAGT